MNRFSFVRSGGWFVVAAVMMSLHVLAGSAKAAVTSFDDIEFWVGTGSNRAALVLDWKDGRDALVWGYQWDGQAYGDQMLLAIAAADPHLHVVMQDWGWGVTLAGMGYDRDGDGFAINHPLTFTDGVAWTNLSVDGGVSLDSDDSYRDGWYVGYWSYQIAESGENLPLSDGGPASTSWSYSGSGLSGRQLHDGSWDGWIYLDLDLPPEQWFNNYPSALAVAAQDPSAAAPQTPAVPEPATAGLMLVGGAALLLRRCGQV